MEKTRLGISGAMDLQDVTKDSGGKTVLWLSVDNPALEHISTIEFKLVIGASGIVIFEDYR